MSEPTLRVRPVRVDDEAEVRAFWELDMAIWRSIEPGFVDVPFAEFRQRVGSPEPGYERRRYVAIASDVFVGLASVLLPMTGNFTHANISVRVAAEWRRRGFGRAIEARIRADLPAQRTELHGCVEFFDGHTGEDWLVAVARLGTPRSSAASSALFRCR